MLSITKLLSDHIKYTQIFNEEVYRSIVLRKKNNSKIKIAMNLLKKNSNQIGNFFIQEIVEDPTVEPLKNQASTPFKSKAMSTETEKWKSAWNMVFFGTNDKPGHILLVINYIRVLYKKGDNRIELNNVLNELTKTNLDMIMKFWTIVDQRIFYSKDEKLLEKIRKGWEGHLVCTKKYIDTLKSNGFNDIYKKLRDDCTDKGANFAEEIDSYLDGYSLVENIIMK